MRKDYKAFKSLKALARSLMPVMKNPDDTATLCGSETIAVVNNYYNNVRQGVKMNVPSAKAIYDDLSVRFEAQKARRAKTEPTK